MTAPSRFESRSPAPLTIPPWVRRSFLLEQSLHAAQRLLLGGDAALALDDDGREVSRRRSPKRGIPADVCAELVSFPTLLSHPNFTLEVALVEEEEVRRPDAKAGWIFVVDNLNVHCSETLVRYVARLEGIDESTLGRKGKSGVLKSMATRQEFLTDPSRRIRCVFTPKHSSWMNQIEIWLSILARKLLRRGSFSSLDELKAKVLAFIDYYNDTMAKPFKWTYEGKVLCA